MQRKWWGIKECVTVLKLALFIIIFGLILMMGYTAFRHLNRKTNETETGWKLAGYSSLLLIVYSGLLVGGLFLPYKGNGFLADVE